jgi:hypothetical protein
VAQAKTTDDKLLDALRSGLVGDLLPLHAAKGKLGLFPGGAAGKALAERAKRESLIIEVPVSPPAGKKGAKPVMHARLTDRGRQLVLDQDSPKQVVEALLQTVRQEATTAGVSQLATLPQVVEAQIVQLRQSLLQGITEQAQAAQSRLDQLHQAMSTVQATLERHRTAEAMPALTLAPEPVVASASDGWLDEVARMVADQRRQNGFKQLSLTEIYQRLQARHPTLTLGQFHDGLRTLHAQRKISLWPFTQALAYLDDPQNALYLDREVKYYADLP